MHVINLGKQKGNKYYKLFIQNRNIDTTKMAHKNIYNFKRICIRGMCVSYGSTVLKCL